ncbi:tail protein [Planifilum fimeticola]|uniref:Tail protein n=1 Tax=Planifilum fimeticola TaxID=201975 RepID=A0A2T0LC21_9BACL|nr:phage tail domain-containing protein [Planifilum fimeticola]PRX39525.1 tail protein [Planifilum fimeticola]
MTTTTKKLGFENLLAYSSMSRDTDGDGLADGFIRATDATAVAEWFFDEGEKAQVINVLSSNASQFSSPGVESSEYIPVVPNQSYTASCEVKGEGQIDTNNGPRILIRWYDQNKQYISGSGTSPSAYNTTGWKRVSITLTAPSNAYFARVKPDFRATPGMTGGTGWYRNVQLQEGNTVTDYEETDFFSVVNVAPTYSKGWFKDTTYKETGVYGYTSETVAAGSATWSGAQIKYTVPVNAKNITIKLWVDASRAHPTDQLRVYVNGNVVITVNGGTAAAVYTASDATSSVIRRGYQTITLQHYRTTSTNGQSITVDDFEVTWEEETNPATIELPTAGVVKYLDFETSEMDPFFTVIDKAAGFSYGFKVTERKSKSGYYSYGVEDVDADGSGIDEAGRAPTIPDSASAAAAIRFKVPITAINPKLKFSALHDATPNGDVGEFTLNGETIWQGIAGPSQGWETVELDLTPGVEYELLLKYTKDDSGGYSYTDSVYLDDLIVYYDIPSKSLLYVATAPTTEIKTTTNNFRVTETFESSTINKFFTVNNPSKLKSGGGKSEYPEAGWVRTTKIAYQGSYSFRAQREKTKNEEDAAVDFIIKVPNGVKNAKVEWWNFVELERGKSKDKSTGYLRLYEEYRIWVNYSIWKEFDWCDIDLTTSKKVSSKWACPWGRWWKETLNLTPGQTYTLTFELQRDAGDSSPIHGRDLCTIDNLTVSWTETPGDVVTIPPQPLIIFDNRDGYKYLGDRSGAEMAPLSFAEYRVFGAPGSVHQFTTKDPRPIDFLIQINGANRNEIRQKVRELTAKLADKPLVLVEVQPEGEARYINCRLADIIGKEGKGEQGPSWKKVVLSFRAFDPFWYGERIVVDGAGPENAGYFPTEVMVKNPGDAEAWPIFKLYGPITNPQVQLVDPNNDLNIYAEFKLTGFTIPAGRYVVVDTRPGRKTIIFDDGQNLYQFLDPSINQLFSIPPGEYVVDLDGGSTDANTKIVVEFQPPYWGV